MRLFVLRARTRTSDHGRNAGLLTLPLCSVMLPPSQATCKVMRSSLGRAKTVLHGPRVRGVHVAALPMLNTGGGFNGKARGAGRVQQQQLNPASRPKVTRYCRLTRAARLDLDVFTCYQERPAGHTLGKRAELPPVST